MERKFQYAFQKTNGGFLAHNTIEEACTFPLHVAGCKCVTLRFGVCGSLACFLPHLQCLCLLATNELRLDGRGQEIITSSNSLCTFPFSL